MSAQPLRTTAAASASLSCGPLLPARAWPPLSWAGGAASCGWCAAALPLAPPLRRIVSLWLRPPRTALSACRPSPPHATRQRARAHVSIACTCFLGACRNGWGGGVTYEGGANRRGRKRGVGVVEGPQEDVLLLLAGLLLGRGGTRRLAARAPAADPAGCHVRQRLTTSASSLALAPTRPRARNATQNGARVCRVCRVVREVGTWPALLR